MPVIRFEVAELERLLGKSVPREDLARTIPMLGADVDDVKGDTWAIEFFPDRPDLYTVEGIARALRAWYGVETGLRAYATRPSGVTVTVDASVEKVRPHIAAAFVRGVAVTEARLQAIIDLQEDLHWGLGARRKRVAIGIHDAAALAPPFTYGTTTLDAPRFVPLQESAGMTPREVLEKHPKGTAYAHLLAGHERVPLILDARQGVVSLPPVINAARTSVTTATRDLFIDVTGTDAWAVGRALNLIVTSLAEAGGAIETVEIVRDGKRHATPDLRPELRELPADLTNKLLGVAFTPAEIAEKLRRMGFGARGGEESVHVEVPAYRADILHAWDLVEDVAIGHGVNNFEHMPLRTPTSGAALPENLLAERARLGLVGLGFLECMSLTLSNPRDQFQQMGRPASGAVEVKNPVTEDHTMLRVSLLPGLLNVLRKNAHRDLPQRLFEVGMVTHVDHEGRVLNERRVAGVVIAGRSNFSEVKGIVQGLMRDLKWEGEVVRADDPSFLAGRCAGVAGRGVFGELHPQVLESFGLGHPVTAFEFHLGRGPGEHVRGPRDAAR
jgi:phenylalanyl-tRNA synthetase beta chain